MTARAASRLALVAAFAAVYVFWGATFLAIRWAVAELPPLLVMAIRCAGGALLLGAWGAVRATRNASVDGASADANGIGVREWRAAAIAGGLLFLGCHGLLAWVERRVTSGQAALVMTAIPLWMVVLSAGRERRAPSRRVVAGLVVGAAGVALLSLGGGAERLRALDALVLVGGALAWALGSLVGRHGARPASAALATAMQLAAGTVWLVAASAVSGELSAWDPAPIGARAVGALAFLIVCGTALGFAAYTWLLTVVSPGAASSYAFVNPLVALALAWLVGDGTPTARALVAAVLVVVAVVLTNAPTHAAPAAAARGPAPRRVSAECAGGAD